jgi:hypothetical protein
MQVRSRTSGLTLKTRQHEIACNQFTCDENCTLNVSGMSIYATSSRSIVTGDPQQLVDCAFFSVSQQSLHFWGDWSYRHFCANSYNIMYAHKGEVIFPANPVFFGWLTNISRQYLHLPGSSNCLVAGQRRCYSTNNS